MALQVFADTVVHEHVFEVKVEQVLEVFPLQVELEEGGIQVLGEQAKTVVNASE